jgi:hypothetical protein
MWTTASVMRRGTLVLPDADVATGMSPFLMDRVTKMKFVKTQGRQRQEGERQDYRHLQRIHPPRLLLHHRLDPGLIFWVRLNW